MNVGEEMKGLDRTRAQRVLDVFGALKAAVARERGACGVDGEGMQIAATLTLAFFTAELREEAQEIHKAIYDGNPK